MMSVIARGIVDEHVVMSVITRWYCGGVANGVLQLQ